MYPRVTYLFACLVAGVLLLGSPALALGAGTKKQPSVASSAAKPPPVKGRKAAPPAKSKPPSKARSLNASSKSADVSPASQRDVPDEIARLGPISVGHPHSGYLINAARLPPSDDYVITMPSHAYATNETIDAVQLCIGAVRKAIPDSSKVMLGSLSGEQGGHLPPHKSHRTGRDADVYFFRLPGAQWSKAATREDIDLERTFALLTCFATRTDVEMILIDKKVQAWLEEYGKTHGADPEWLQDMFHDKGSNKTSLVRHVPGHVAHMHVRFVSPKARRLGVEHYDRLVKLGLVVPERSQATHEVQKGDTLSGLAALYKVKVDRILELNQLSSTVIRLGQKLVLEQAVDLRGARDRVVVPQRRLPKDFVEPQVVTAAPVAKAMPTAAPDPADSSSGQEDVQSPTPPGPKPIARPRNEQAGAAPERGQGPQS